MENEKRKRYPLMPKGNTDAIKRSLGITPEMAAALKKKYPESGAALRDKYAKPKPRVAPATPANEVAESGEAL